MPEKPTLERAKRAKAEGKAPSTQAGEFIKEEMEHVKQGKHGIKSTKQAVAIGLSKARKAGVDLPPPKSGKIKTKTKSSQTSAYKKGQKEGPLRKRTNKQRNNT